MGHLMSVVPLLLAHLDPDACRQVMKESKGRVNPALMNKILMQKLNAE